MPPRRAVLGGLAAAALVAPMRGPGAETVAAAGLRLRLEPVADRLRAPVALAFDGAGGMLVAEAAGALAWIRPGRRIERLSGLPPVLRGPGAGLFDVLPAPGGGATPRLLISAARSYALSQSRLMVSRHAWDRLSRRLIGAETVWREEPPRDAARRFGGRMAAMPDGGFVIAAGDRGDRDAAADPAQAAGKIHRLDFSGAPWPLGPRLAPDAPPGRWSAGHRNPVALALRPADGSLWAADAGGGEPDFLIRVLGGMRHLTPAETAAAEAGAAVRPAHVWDPPIGVGGMCFLSGARFAPWAGRLVVGARRGLRLLSLSGDRVTAEAELLAGRLGPVRDLRIDASGMLWALTGGHDGALWRIYPG
ncbi:MAG: hypothetical protein D6686_04265 [Alphaproteobacteria bacterium]|nr:MAG: hypothetical protein D6686_04265 [Alphaproteobacteria bacterium]